jgi:mannose-1-phosphate guanylyltransferase
VTLPAYAVVMAGGGGTRFWPLSRASRPKHVLSLNAKRTLLQETVKRLIPTFTSRRVLVVTAAQHEDEVRRQLPRIPRDHILVEPQPRNTAACLALAADWLAAHVGEAVMLATPADHVVGSAAALRRSMETALTLASSENCLVTIGVPPTRPETGYGYIECGEGIRGLAGRASWVKHFHEKPALPIAKRYARSGRHLWNSGIFAWRISVFQCALKQCAPEIFRAIDQSYASLGGRQGRIRKAYRRTPSLPIDLAVMQPLSTLPGAIARIAVVRGSFDWIDAGSWDAMAQLWPRDAAGNATLGRVLAIDSQDSIVYCPERLVALVGVKGLVVVDAGDVLLVCPRERAQDVRQVSGALKKRGWAAYL